MQLRCCAARVLRLRAIRKSRRATGVRFIPGRQRLQIRYPGEPGLCVRRYRLGRHDDIEQGGPMGERTIDGGRQILGALDSLGMHSERLRHGGVIGELQPRADHLAVRLNLVVHLDLPGAIGPGSPPCPIARATASASSCSASAPDRRHALSKSAR